MQIMRGSKSPEETPQAMLSDDMILPAARFVVLDKPDPIRARRMPEV